MTRTRSIGARSDFSDKTGEGVEDEDFEPNGAPSRTWSIYKEDASTGIPAHEDPDDPINRYVQDQLSRIKSNESQEYAEELAAQTNGTADDRY